MRAIKSLCLLKNLKLKKKSKKLDYIKVEVFSINVKEKTISFQLKLSKDAKVHFMFYTLLLKLVDL